MEEAAQRYWEQGQMPCPACGGTGVPVVLEITDAETREAVREGLACLGDCCYDGALGVELQCVRCGHQWSRDAGAAAPLIG